MSFFINTFANFSSYGKLKSVRFFLFLTSLVFMLSFSCSNSDTDDNPPEKKVIVAFYTPYAIGDMTYGDSISLALHKSSYKHDFTLIEICPTSWDQARQQTNEYLTDKRLDKRDVLYVFCDDLYLPEVEKFSDKSNKKLLMFDAQAPSAKDYIYSVSFSFYGIAYEAGVLANELIAKDAIADVLIADSSNKSLNTARIAFEEGLGQAGDRLHVFNIEISSEESNYNQEDFLYFYYSWLVASKEYIPAIIFPLCGGSIHGIFRYNRDFGEQTAYTIGMDRDMSAYTNRVPYSLVKNFDKAIEQCVSQWQKKELPHHQQLGLKDGYTELVIAPAYQTKLAARLTQIHESAIEKEQAYENKK